MVGFPPGGRCWGRRTRCALLSGSGIAVGVGGPWRDGFAEKSHVLLAKPWKNHGKSSTWVRHPHLLIVKTWLEQDIVFQWMLYFNRDLTWQLLWIKRSWRDIGIWPTEHGGITCYFFGKFDGEDNSWTIPQDPEVELQISSNPPKNDHGQLHRHAAFEPKVAHNSNIWNTGLILKHTPVLNFASRKIAWAKREHSAMPRYVLFSEQLLFLTVGPEGASIFKKPHNSWWTWVNMFHSYWGMGALKFYG